MILIDTEDICIVTETIKISSELLVMNLKVTNKNIGNDFKAIATVQIKDDKFSSEVCIKNIHDKKLCGEYSKMISEVVLNAIKNMR